MVNIKTLTPRQTVIKMTPSPTRFSATLVDDIQSPFHLFISQPIDRIIVDMTNLQGRCVFQKKWKSLDQIDLHAYIEILVLLRPQHPPMLCSAMLHPATPCCDVHTHRVVRIRYWRLHYSVRHNVPCYDMNFHDYLKVTVPLSLMWLLSPLFITPPTGPVRHRLPRVWVCRGFFLKGSFSLPLSQ